ncbi:MAG TPA: hypothetical protein VGY76_08395 [Solirubrobacteraceae bacterium]|nr:hypothetical protein [Solirubrobacteraceae bacterium]
MPLVLASTFGLFLCTVCTAVASLPLPDGRAWEMVSPLDKNGGDIRGIEGISFGGVVQARPDGEGITFASLASFGSPQGAPLGNQYVARRGAGQGWQSQNVSLPMGNQVYPLGAGTPYTAFSEDLASGLVFGGLRGLGRRPVATPPLAGAPAGYENYYSIALSSGALQSLLTGAPSVPAGEFGLAFVGATPDLSRVVLASPNVLASGGIEKEERSNLYEWERATGLFRTVSILPGGTADTEIGLLLGGGGHSSSTDHAVSADGSRVVWTGTAPESLEGSGLYLREGLGPGQTPRTLQIDASQGGAAGSSHGGVFFTASGDDSRIFFTDTNRLTANSTASSGGLGDLYVFEPARPEGERLADLTVDTEPGAEVLGVVGASEDGSYLYFVARGALAPGAPAGEPNLYLWRAGEAKPRFIATLAPNDEHGSEQAALGVAYDWSPSVALRTSRVSGDGTRLVFMSERSLTHYNNTVRSGVSCGKDASEEPLPATCQEVFLYEAGANRLSCVSCNPSGAQPSGPSGIPGGTPFADGKATYRSRVLSAQGDRVFFDSADALIAQDTNGREDVYEYEGGHVYLLSGGQSASGASFVDASANGNDVFFITRAQLVDQDTDQLVDLYDARAPHAPAEAVGFPAPPAPIACESEECRSAIPPSPTLATFSSATFSGAGNAVPAEPKPKTKPRARRPKPKKRRRRAAHARRTRTGRVGGVASGASR